MPALAVIGGRPCVVCQWQPACVLQMLVLAVLLQSRWSRGHGLHGGTGECVSVVSLVLCGYGMLCAACADKYIVPKGIYVSRLMAQSVEVAYAFLLSTGYVLSIIRNYQICKSISVLANER